MKQLITMTALAALLAGCGGSGDDTDSGGTSVMSSGAISQFGSAVVNDVRYETDNTRLISDDDGSVVIENPTDAELRELLGLGQVVTVRGTRNDDGTGTATTIRFDNELVGEIESVSTIDLSFVVLGQTVAVNLDTIIDDSIIERLRGTEVADDQRFGDLPATETLDLLLPAGLPVEVSGYPTHNGIEATRIEDADAPGPGGFEAEVKGLVSGLNGGRFNINTLTVTYDASDLDDSFGGRDLREGDFVEVKGVPNLALNLIDATSIELEDDFLDDDFDEGEIEIEGMIMEVRADNPGPGGVIVINGMEIRVDDVTPFNEGTRVEIHGTLRSDGSVAVRRIEDEAEDTVRTEDQAVSADASSFTTRLGLIIAPTERSRLEDDTIEDDDHLSLADFLGNVTGQRVEARGFPLAGSVAWTRVEIEDDDMDCRLRGPVASITGVDSSNFSFTIEGVTIDVSTVSDNNFEGTNGRSIGRQVFFDELDVGDVVQATSDSAGLGCVAGTLTAREVQQKPDDGAIFDDGSHDGGPGHGGGGPGDDEIVGPASNILESSFDVAGVTVTVNGSTIIDDSIIEAARGVEVNDEAALGDIPETLPELLTEGLRVAVDVDRTSGVLALRIEDL